MSKPLRLSKEFDLILLCQQSHIKLLILLGTLVFQIQLRLRMLSLRVVEMLLVLVKT